MDNKDIIDALKQNDLRLADIARRCGVSRATVTLVAKRTTRSRRVAQALCDGMGKTLHDVFDDFYSEEEEAA